MPNTWRSLFFLSFSLLQLVNGAGAGDISLVLGSSFRIASDSPTSIFSQGPDQIEVNDEFGRSAAFLGDLNNDSLVEIAVGVPDRNPNDRGGFYIVSLNGTTAQSAFLFDNQDISLTGRDLMIGASLHFVMRNGVRTLFVGAESGVVYEFTLNSPTPQLVMQRTVAASFDAHVMAYTGELSGNPRFLLGSPAGDGVLSVIGFTPNLQVLLSVNFSNESPNGQFGTSVAILGLNATGQNTYDVFVGVPRRNDQFVDQGGIYLLRFNSQLNAVVNSTLYNYIAIEALGHTLDPGGRFGQSIALLNSDLDGDGHSEVVVGATGSVSETGSIYILSFDALNARFVAGYRLQPPDLIPSDSFGSSVQSIGDYNGDGIVDILVGSRNFDRPGTSPSDDTGAVYLIFIDRCGDAIVLQEECDDGNILPGDGCNSECRIEFGFTCPTAGQLCQPICGNAQIEIPVLGACDDGNQESGDGCSSACFIETGFRCTELLNGTSVCEAICGDRQIVGMEECDDGNVLPNDGCSSACQIEVMPPVGTSSNGTSSNLTAVIASVVIVGVLLLALLILIPLCLIYLIKRRKPSVELEKILPSDISVLKDVKIGDVIGKGHFGVVYRGLWQGNHVALKTITQELDQISNELSILHSLRHPQILFFYGICAESDQTFMVTEFMDRGDMFHFLQKSPELTIKDLAQFGGMVLSGMVFLHSQNVIHRDLACRNLLVSSTSDDKFIVKIADFGLSRVTEEFYTSHSKEIPVRWTAPEALQFCKYSPASDVWSFGIVLWEIFSRGAIPYPGMNNQEVAKKVRSGFRLPAPLQTPAFVVLVMKQCWAAEAEARPTMKALLEEHWSGPDAIVDTGSTKYASLSTPVRPLKLREAEYSYEQVANSPKLRLDELVQLVKEQQQEIDRLRNLLHLSPLKPYDHPLSSESKSPSHSPRTFTDTYDARSRTPRTYTDENYDAKSTIPQSHVAENYDATSVTRNISADDN